MSAATSWRLPDAFGTPVEVRGIERELSSQLLDLRADKTAPVQRVRMSNLVIYTDRMDTAAQVADELLDIATVHPARVLLLIADPEAGSDGLTASVRVQCRALSKQQQACSEQVALHVPTALADRLPFAVRALLIGDLPTNLWWASAQPPPFAATILYELSGLAQQVIYDSVGWLEPARGVAATASWLDRVEVAEPGRWRVASDLNWRRLKYWRRLVSQALDPAAGAEGNSMKEMTVEHGPHAVVQGYELTAWLALRLGWRLQGGRTSAGTETSWTFVTPTGEAVAHVRRLSEGRPTIRAVRFRGTVQHKPGLMNLTQLDVDRIGVTLEGEGVDAQPRTIIVPPQSPADLVGRQLSDRERDPVFRQTMDMAQKMAQSVIT